MNDWQFLIILFPLRLHVKKSFNYQIMPTELIVEMLENWSMETYLVVKKILNNN
jgi:hypothetical protein